MGSPSYENPLNKIQSAYDCIQIASSLHLLMPEIAFFAEIIFTNPLFYEFLQTQKGLILTDLSPLLFLKKAVHKELEATIKLLEKYSHIHIVSRYLEECKLVEKNTSAMSWERVCRQSEIIMNLCIVIKHNKGLSFDNPSGINLLLKKLITEDERGGIIEYKFVPSLKKFDKEFLIFDRKKRTTIWYSLHKLAHVFAIYDIKNAENTYSHFVRLNQYSAAAILKKDFYQVEEILSSNNNMDCSKTALTVEELKIHTQRVWTIAKPILLPNNPDIFYYAYSDYNDLRKGILTKGSNSAELVGNSAQLLHLLVNRYQTSVNEACEELQLSSESIRNARRTISTNLKKIFKITDYVSSKGIISLNYSTQLR